MSSPVGGSVVVQSGADEAHPLDDPDATALSIGGLAVLFTQVVGMSFVTVYENGRETDFDALLGGPADGGHRDDGWSTLSTVTSTVFAWASSLTGVKPCRGTFDRPAVATLWPAT